MGKSIFSLKDKSEEGGPPSLVELVKREKLKYVFVIEDNMTGFPEAFKKIGSKTTKLIYGLRFSFCGDSKLIAIAKNDAGIALLNKLHTEQAFNGFISDEFLSYLFFHFVGETCLQICVPFYDSFLFKNIMEYGSNVVDVTKYKPIFFVENNELPFDQIVRKKVEKYCRDFGLDFVETKTILYETRKDAEALQAYKIITNRKKSFKEQSLSRPELLHFGSREFCWESFKEIESKNIGE